MPKPARLRMAGRCKILLCYSHHESYQKRAARRRYAWVFDASNFTHVLSIYAGHFGDVLFHSVGFPKKLTAVVESQFPVFTVEETGQTVPNTTPNAAMVIGALEDGGLFSIQIEGGQRHCTGLQIDITGTEGVLRVTNPRAFQNKEDNSIEGVNGDGSSLTPLPVPAEYNRLRSLTSTQACKMSPISTPRMPRTKRTAPQKRVLLAMRCGNIN
jgi:predicted dehydrogenase